MKFLLRLVLALSLAVCMLFGNTLPNAPVLVPEAFNAKTAFSAVRSAGKPVLLYVAGSTIKIEQLLGEEDKQLHKPTLSRTVTRYGSKVPI